MVTAAELHQCWQIQLMKTIKKSDCLASAVAIRCEEIEITYRELLVRSSVIRKRLCLSHGVTIGSRVIVAFDDSAESWIEFAVLHFSLGLLGASFTILDTRSKSLSAEARTHIMKLYNPDIFIRIGAVHHSHPDSIPAVELTFDRAASVDFVDLYSHTSAVNVSSEAFVDWTSGSSGGLPKGCVCTHKTLMNMYKQKWSSEHGFMDPSVVKKVGYNLFFPWYWWQPICHGGTSVLLRDSEVRDLSLLESALERNHLDAIDCLTPSLLKVMCMHLSTQSAFPRTILVSGEALPLDLCKAYLKRFPHNRLVNVFSTTETGDAGITEVSRELLSFMDDNEVDIASCPIQKALHGVKLLLIPIPDEGEDYAELVVSGVGANEYIGDPIATAKGFGTLGWISRDRVKKLDNGLLAVTGRLDDCVKVRGFKIDLKAIENACGVNEAVALAHDDRIILFVKGNGSNEDEIRRNLHENLSPSHVPQLVEFVDEFPLTRTGKLDRNVLLARINTTGNPSKMYAESLLGRVLSAFDHVGLQPCLEKMKEADISFWTRGGTSLMAISVCRLLEIPVSAFFDLFTASPQEVLKLLEQGSPQTVQKEPNARGKKADRIAIVGMSGRWPGNSKSMTAEKLAELLSNAYHPLSTAPEEGGGNVGKGFFLDESLIKGFDCGYFPELTASAVSKIDPHQRIFLEMAAECLIDAGVAVRNGNGSQSLNCGVFASSGSLSHFIELLAGGESLETIRETDPGKYLELELACDKDYIALRTSKLLNLSGPSVTVQAACASALVAVVQAVNAIRQGQCEMALAGGVSLVLPQKPHSASLGLIWSSDGACRPFDANANGTSNCNGGHCFLLKSHPAALRDGDAVYAVIEGVGLSNDGFRGKDFAAPSVSGHVSAIQKALADSALKPAQVTMVEAHGTGTLLGDPMEYSALVSAYRSDCEGPPLSIGSVKGNVGHANTAAGALGLAKATVSVWKKCLFKSGSFSKLNPHITASPLVKIQEECQPWKVDNRRIAGVSSLGMGGTNCHVILAEHLEGNGSDRNDEPAWNKAFSGPLLISGHSPEAVNELRQQFMQVFDSEATTQRRADDIAYTMSRRVHGLFRSSFSSLSDLLAATACVEAKPGAKTAVLLFPGQGGEFPSHFPIDEDIIEILHFNPVDEFSRSASPIHSQLSLFAIGFTAAKKIIASLPEGIEVICCGHSLGEYTAAAVCGLMSLEDALMLVQKRAELLVLHASQGAMAAVSATVGQIEDVISREEFSDIEIACINKDDRITISGPKIEIDKFIDHSNLSAKMLSTSGAFHSKFTEPVAEALLRLSASVEFHPVKKGFRFLSSKAGNFIERVDALFWSQHTRNRVRMADCAKMIHALNDAIVLDVGPGNMMTRIVKNPTTSPLTILPVPGDFEFSSLYVKRKLWEAGFSVDFDLTGKRVLGLPTIGWSRQICWPRTVQSVKMQRPEIESLGYQEQWIDVKDNKRITRECTKPRAIWWAHEMNGQEAKFTASVFEERQNALVLFKSENRHTPMNDIICENAHATIRIIQSLIRARSQDQFMEVSVTFVVQDILAFSGLCGVLRCAMNEHPDLNLSLIRSSIPADDALRIPLLIPGEYKLLPDLVQMGKIKRFWIPRESGIQPGGRFLLTGGLGGIGAALITWLIDSKNAQHIYILSRREVDVADFGWTADRVSVLLANLADVESVRKAISMVDQLSMVFHLAGEVYDGLIADVNLSVEEMVRMSSGKVAGAISLVSVCPANIPIILFSSTSALLGSPGQAIYAAANAVLDRMAEDRNVISIQWGGWSGKIKNSMAARFDLDPIPECERYIDPEVGFDMLDRISGNKSASLVAVTDIYDWAKYAEKTQVNQGLVSQLYPAPSETFLVTAEQAIMSDRTGFLLDHTDESGEALVPATGLLSAMISRVKNNLSSVSFSSPLRLGRFYSIDVVGNSVSVSSEAKSLVHATAHVLQGNKGVSSLANSLINRVSEKFGSWAAQDVNQMYMRLAEGGFAYGPSFKLVSHAWKAGKLVIASVQDVDFRIEEGVYSSRSCALDACTHVACLLDARAGSAFPSSVGSVSFESEGSLYPKLKKILESLGVEAGPWITVVRESPLGVSNDFSENVTVDVLAVSSYFSIVFEQLVLTPSVMRSETEIFALSEDDKKNGFSPVLLSQRHSIHTPTVPFESVLSGKLTVNNLPIFLSPNLSADHIRIATRYYGLSFLDVLAATGVMPKSMFGGEFSGTVVSVGTNVKDLQPGDSVCALCPGGFRSHIDIDKNFAAKISSEYLKESSTVPVSVCTALLAMDRARLKEGDTVIVHNASGALGQAVISVIRRSFTGMRIIATCSRGKREFVKSLSVDEVIDSRDFSTWPASLDNSVHASIGALHAELLNATIPLLRSFGIIVDVGKRLQTENQPVSLAPFVRGLTYTTAHLDELMRVDSEAVSRLMKSAVESGITVPYSVYSETEKALEFLSSGSHTGKVIVAMPQVGIPPRFEGIQPSFTAESSKWDSNRVRVEIARIFHAHSSCKVEVYSEESNLHEPSVLFVHRSITQSILEDTLIRINPIGKSKCLVLVPDSVIVGSKPVRTELRNLRKELLKSFAKSASVKETESAWLSQTIAKHVGLSDLSEKELNSSMENIGIDSLGRLQLWQSFKKKFPHTRLSLQFAASSSIRSLVQGTGSSSNQLGKSRWLGIHGFRTNKDILQHQLSQLLTLFPDIKLHPVNAPHSAKGPGPQPGEGFEWWASNSHTSYDDGWIGQEGLSESIQFLERYVEAHGPFEGVIGFSQGAAMAHSLLTSGRVKKGILFSPAAPRGREWPPIPSNKGFKAIVITDPGDDSTAQYNCGDIEQVVHSNGHAIPQIENQILDSIRRLMQ